MSDSTHSLSATPVSVTRARSSPTDSPHPSSPVADARPRVRPVQTGLERW
ncbi:hypothetical protein [Natrarchaeobaculum aegyptiacum]|nr:hypothetical protein [Natrarchaeobaculum aegyptiacum]